MKPVPRSLLFRLLIAGLFLPSLVLGPQSQAQYVLRTSVIGSGGTDASSGIYNVRATTGQAVVGPIASGAFALGQGFWYAAGSGGGDPGPALTLIMAPVNPPIAVPAGGGNFRFDITITNDSASPQDFQLWTAITLPDGNTRRGLRAQDISLAAGETFGPVRLRQRVRANLPPGNYQYHAYVGVFDNTVVAEDRFDWTKAAAVTASRRQTVTPVDVSSVLARTSGVAVQANAARQQPLVTTRELIEEWEVYHELTGMILVEPNDLLALVQSGEESAKIADDSLSVEIIEHAEASPVVASSSMVSLPEEVTLVSAYPNPFHVRTTLRVGLPTSTTARLEVYDVRGRRVAVLLDGERDAGWHEVVLDAGTLAGGVYVARMVAGDRVITQRLTLIR